MNYYSNVSWLKDLFPHGINAHESILISGPGGSGKPLVELAFVDAWLKCGGSVIGIPLQYPTLEMVGKSIQDIYQTNFSEYPGHVSFISFDPALDEKIIIKDQIIYANLIRPNIWEKAIEQAMSKLKPSKLGVLVFGSALNLLLFNDHYKSNMVSLIKDVLSQKKNYTSLFTVSNNVYPDDIVTWENSADNLMATELNDEKVLTLHINRIKSMRYTKDQIVIPIDSKTLSEIEAIARSTRNKNIKDIKAII